MLNFLVEVVVIHYNQICIQILLGLILLMVYRCDKAS